MTRIRALYWWLDRWRNSSAFLTMTLEQQGAYLNLLFAAASLGGALPDDDRILAKACGDALAWPKLREAVLARFTKNGDGWRNETLDEVLEATATRIARYRRYSERRGTGRGTRRGTGRGTGR